MYNVQSSSSILNDFEIDAQGFDNVHGNQTFSAVSDFFCPITLEEVCRAILQLKSNKASGVDEIPGEVLKNAKVIEFLHKLLTHVLIQEKFQRHGRKVL